MMLLTSIAVLVHISALVLAIGNVTSGSITPPERLDIHSPSSVSVVLGQELSLNFTIVNEDASSQHRCNLTLGGILLRTDLNKKSIIYNDTIRSNTTFKMSCSLVGSEVSVTHTTTVVVHIPATAQASQSQVQLRRNMTCKNTQCDVICTGVGWPLPTVSWFKNGVSVSQVSSSDVYQVGIKSNATAYISRLKLSKASFSDSGSYNCTSTNVVGPERKMVIKHITVVVQIKGPPEEDTSKKLKFYPNNNKVEFRCYFIGNPLPDLEWKFSNGSKLPSTSQFQIGKQQRQSEFHASLELTVYGTNCRDTNFLQFQCFATNSYASSVPSKVFMADIGIFLHFKANYLECRSAISQCQNIGGSLPVAHSQAALESIKSAVFGALNYGFWVSVASANYFTDWSYDLQSADGCFYISPKVLRPLNRTHGAYVACEVRPSPQANVTHHIDECNGTRVNISWNIQPGAESLGHRVFYEQNKSVTTPPGQSSVILTNLKPRFSYNIKVLPLFEGCSGVPLTKNHIIITGRGLLNSPISITMKKIGTVCNISWNVNNIQTELGGVAMKYIGVPQIKRNDTNETISKSNRTILHKSAMQHTITKLVPNRNYKVYVGAVPSSPCQDTIPVVWSKNFTGSCITEPKGPPEEDTTEKLMLSPNNNNKVEFRCYFIGNPLPDLEWKFSNGSKLPSTSQFQIGKQQRQSEFHASLEMTVYGTNCRDTNFLQFQCFATNSYASSVPSKVFMADIGTFLHFKANYLECRSAIRQCQNIGGSLPVAHSQAALESIKSAVFGALNYGFWVSVASAKYFTDWSYDLQSADGCFYISPKVLRPQKWTQRAYVVCEVRPSPQANVTHHVDECDGTRVNISWNIQPGAESLGHRVFYEQNKSVTTPPGQSSVILTNLKPRFSYDIKVLPLFEGCSGVPLTKNHIITTGRGLLNSPISITMKKIGTVCNISWNANNIQTELGGIAMKYIDVPHMKRNYMNETISKSNRTILHKSAMQHTITEMIPNRNYKVYVGAVPSSPCQDKLPVAWSKNFTGSCITEPKGPSSVPLSSKTPVSVAGGVKVFLEPVSERNGLISCYFIIARKVVNGSNNNIERNITKLPQADEVVKDGDTYIAIAMLPFAQTTEVTFGDSSYSCCDVTDISGTTSDCSVMTTRNVARGYNRPLIPGANYSYYVITVTPVSGGSALIYTASSPQGFTYRPTSGPLGHVVLYVGLTLAMLAILVILVLAFIHRRSLKKRLCRRFPKEQPVAAPNGVPLQPVRQSYYEDSFESDDDESVASST